MGVASQPYRDTVYAKAHLGHSQLKLHNKAVRVPMNALYQKTTQLHRVSTPDEEPAFGRCRNERSQTLLQQHDCQVALIRKKEAVTQKVGVTNRVART